MKKIFKKFRVCPIIIIVVYFLISQTLLLQLGLKNQDVRRVTTQDQGKMNYVLVNEDIGTMFNNKTYNLGQEFVRLINQDTKNNWQTASRSVAEAGFKQGAYEAEIVLPQNFSEKLLALESMNPEQAEIRYKAKEGQSEIANLSIQQKVGTILNSFNQKIITMYFASVLGNLSEAQRNVSGMVTGQQNLQNNMLTTVQTPFKDLPSTFDSVVSHANMLSSQNKMWKDQQDNFSKGTERLLEDTSQSLEKQLKDLEAYQALQEKISQINHKNSQQVLKAQAADDETTYKLTYDSLHSTTKNQMDQFSNENAEEENPTILGNNEKVAQTFSETQTQRIQELNTKVQECLSQAKELRTLRQEIAANYFSSSDKTPETVSDDEIRLAILNKIEATDTQDETNPKSYLVDSYITHIKNAVQTIPSKDLQNVLKRLKETNLLSQSTYNKYLAEQTVIERFAKEENIGLGVNANFDYTNAQNGTYPESNVFDTLSTLKLNIDPTKEVRIRLYSFTNTIQLSDEEKNTLAADIESQINTEFTTETIPMTAKVSVINSTEFGVAFTKIEVPESSTNESSSSSTSTTSSSDTSTTNSTSDSSSTSTSDTSSDSSSAAVGSSETSSSASSTSETSTSTSEEPKPVEIPKAISITVHPKLTWKYSEAEKQHSYNETKYQWLVNDKEQFQDTLSSYVDLNSSVLSLQKDLPKLLQHLSVLDQASQQIVTLFGSATNVAQDVQTFANAIAQNTNKTIRQQADISSIYYSYDNISLAKKKQLITDGMFESFKTQGIDLYNKVNQQRQTLLIFAGTAEQKESLNGVIAQLTLPTTFLSETQKLKDWHKQALTAQEESYKKWKTNPTLPTTLKEYGNYSVTSLEEDTNLYFDHQFGKNLYDTFKGLIASSVSAAQSTKTTAAKIEQLDSQFQSLSKDTNQVKSQAQNVLQNVNEVVSDSVEKTSNNQEYAKNFDNVMKNARTGGQGNGQVFQFLSNPLNAEGEFGAKRQTSVVPYFLTLIGAFLVFGLSYSLHHLKLQRKQSTDKLFRPTKFWSNTPITLTSLVLAGVSGLTLGILTKNNVSNMQTMGWIFYILIVVASGTILGLFIWRMAPRMMVYLIGFLLGSYLLLTPLLGMNISPNSWINWLFKLSPLQNIENGYTVLINQGALGIGSIVIFIGLILLGVALNLFVPKITMLEDGE